MPTLTADAIMPDYTAADTDAGYELSSAYLERCRRVPVGPAVTLVFENRRTLQFRLDELRSFARLAPPSHARAEWEWYSRLMPAADAVRASVVVRRPGCRPTPAMREIASAVAAGEIVLDIGGLEIVGRVSEGRGGDRVLGPSYWAEFAFDADAVVALADFATPAWVEVRADGYTARERLPSDARRSLLADLLR